MLVVQVAEEPSLLRLVRVAPQVRKIAESKSNTPFAARVACLVFGNMTSWS